MRVWHGGAIIGADNEINGLTFGGVGSGTIVEHCEVAFNLDDGFEFFGGTVNAKWLSVLFCGDDAFDADQGYVGRVQFLFVMNGFSGDHALEIDSAWDKENRTVIDDAMPRSYPRLTSLTLLGGGSRGRATSLALLRRGAGGMLSQAVLMNSPYGVELSTCGSVITSQACGGGVWSPAAPIGSPSCDDGNREYLFLDRYNIFSQDVTTPYSLDSTCENNSQVHGHAVGLYRSGDPELKSVNTTCLDYACLDEFFDPLPRPGSLACTAPGRSLTNSEGSGSGSFEFESVECYGAFKSPTDNWLDQWSWLSTRGQPQPRAPPPMPPPISPPPPDMIDIASLSLGVAIVVPAILVALVAAAIAIWCICGRHKSGREAKIREHEGGRLSNTSGFALTAAPATVSKASDSDRATASAISSSLSSSTPLKTSMFDALSALNHYKQYMEVRHLGGGLQGRAVLLRSPDGTDSVVSKQTTVVGIGANELARIEREVRILSSLNHPHIIAYRCCFQRDELLCIMTEYAGGGTLRREIRQRAAAGVGEGATSATSAPSSRLAVPHSAHLTDGRILVWMAQLASALHAVHAAGALHRDLKPENIFLTTTADIKLGDFGLSRNVIMGTEETMPEDGQLDRPSESAPSAEGEENGLGGGDDDGYFAQTACGTPYYMAPEQIHGQRYSRPIDLWALGCVLYELLTLRRAFAASSFPQLAEVITKSMYDEGLHQSAPHAVGIKALATREMLLHPKPQERTTLPQLLVFLRALLEEQQATGGEPEPSPLLTQASVVTPAEPTTQAAVSCADADGSPPSLNDSLERKRDGASTVTANDLAAVSLALESAENVVGDGESSQPTASERGESASDLSNSLANSQNVAEQVREYNATADARV